MIEIIRGRKYNTETAEMVAEYATYDRRKSDLSYYEEELYKKKTGEFFLHGMGGPMTKYAVAVGNAYSDGEKIIPLTEEQAKEWVERYMDAEDYEEIFGEVEE